jgi:hypothetical protein
VRSARRREERSPLRSALASLGSWHDCHEWHRRLPFGPDGPGTLWTTGGRFVFVPPISRRTRTLGSGLGNWTKQEIVTAIRTGVRPDGRTLAPVMPWRGYAALTNADGGDSLVARSQYLVRLGGCNERHTASYLLGKAEMSPYLGGGKVGRRA